MFDWNVTELNAAESSSIAPWYGIGFTVLKITIKSGYFSLAYILTHTHTDNMPIFTTLVNTISKIQ